MNDDDDDDDVFCVPGIMVVLIIVVNILATAFGAPAWSWGSNYTHPSDNTVSVLTHLL